MNAFQGVLEKSSLLVRIQHLLLFCETACRMAVRTSWFFCRRARLWSLRFNCFTSLPEYTDTPCRRSLIISTSSVLPIDISDKDKIAILRNLKQRNIYFSYSLLQFFKLQNSVSIFSLMKCYSSKCYRSDVEVTSIEVVKKCYRSAIKILDLYYKKVLSVLIF